MAIKELKESCHELIDLVDEETLEEVYSILHASSLSTIDVNYQLTPKQEAILNESILSAERGEVIPHEQVKAKFSKWLTR